jgi:hypothetical protein
MARRLSDLSRLLMNRREPDGRFYAAHIDGRWRVDRPRGGRTALFHRTDCLTLRDVIQNHLFRVLANLAMEPPARIDSESMREEKRKVLKSITPIDPEDLGRGQFRGYRDEPGVTPDSQVETFAALRLRIDILALAGGAILHPRRYGWRPRARAYWTSALCRSPSDSPSSARTRRTRPSLPIMRTVDPASIRARSSSQIAPQISP